MIRSTFRGWMPLLAAGVLLAVSANAQPPQHASKRTKSASKQPALVVELSLEPKAIDLLKAAGDHLAAAKSMRFTAVVSYENPSLLGPPLVYTTKSDVVVQRPDKLRVITSGDGPASEFYYDGTTMAAFEPAANLVAVSAAPPTIDAALKAAYDTAAIYFPFTDLVVADPYGDMAEDLKFAFYIGQSHVVGETTTDMLAYGNDSVFVQIWIGAEDKLPRMVRALYRNDPVQLRHQLELSNWQLDLDVPPDVFGSSQATAATRIEFARPDAQLPLGARRPGKPSKGKGTPSKTQ